MGSKQYHKCTLGSNLMSDIPSAQQPELMLLDSWVSVKKTSNSTIPKYCHLLLKPKENADSGIIEELFNYIDHAHEGARRQLRASLGESLHPLHHGTEYDPAFGYPHKLGDSALKGFFGEIMAGIIAVYFAGVEDFKWEVPVYLFRTHIVGFQQLEYMKQSGNWGRQIVGRTGDDGLAFARNREGAVIAWLACEAKCTGDHSATLIKDNHDKLSQPITRPIDLLRVIDALNDYERDDYSQNWVKSLRTYYWSEPLSELSPTRCDLSVYVCGRSPSRNNTWISTTTPHEAYKGRRSLVSGEFHLEGLNEFINTLYTKMESSR